LGITKHHQLFVDFLVTDTVLQENYFTMNFTCNYAVSSALVVSSDFFIVVVIIY